jgi:hypothetical protein
MRVAIVGSREYLDLDSVVSYVADLPIDTVVITGGAKGVDKTTEAAARRRGLEVVVHYANWNLYGKAAGQIRNQVVVDDCDRLVAFWDGTSPGTKGAISLASKANKLEKVFRDRNPTQGSLF